MAALLIAQIGLLQKVKHQAVYFPGNIIDDRFIIVLVTDFGGKYFDREAKIICPIYLHDQIGQADLIPEVDDA